MNASYTFLADYDMMLEAIFFIAKLVQQKIFKSMYVQYIHLYICMHIFK